MDRLYLFILLFLIYMIINLIGLFTKGLSVLKQGRLTINILGMISLLLVKKFAPEKNPYIHPFHLVVLSIWNIYFIKETAEEMTFTDHPFEMFGADQSTVIFIVHVFVLSYSVGYSLLILFPIYFAINLAIVFKIRHDTSIDATDK